MDFLELSFSDVTLIIIQDLVAETWRRAGDDLLMGPTLGSLYLLPLSELESLTYGGIIGSEPETIVTYRGTGLLSSREISSLQIRDYLLKKKSL